MRTRDLSFDLPRELIAQEPPAERGRSRLMVADRAGGALYHRTMDDLAEFVSPGTVMVFNDSRVRRARIFGENEETGRRQEFLLVAPLAEDGEPPSNGGDHGRWLVIGPGARRLKRGRRFLFGPESFTGTITDVREPYRVLSFSRPLGDSWLEKHGHVPLPPYIHRDDVPRDAERYQTVYARASGSVAAPTAGLHFTSALLDTLREKGVHITFVTLHVGIGTFLPVRTANLEDHVMHRELYTITDETADTINAARIEGRTILAVGTTAVRTLESAATTRSAGEGDVVRAGTGETGIFIYPGYRFRIVDRLFTNFHTPESTLLAMVSAFAGREQILAWYGEAIRHRYRFFSYGDAMLMR
ncbi:MAG: tRNA preQ1(34) S-adenosylmethionine ribosyltransferase-isomerase QueA [Spirochaetaceae bacterium]|nr:MAG: tRNA preQ1(34) S-adenosylmethionine ribosyltransferase-isomerase QueA [Spirochaetaceae bacterium]